jgi:RND superfamily putative drug exporter
VLAAWIAAFVLVVVLGSTVGSAFSQGVSLPGTESDRAAQLLDSRFPAQSGDQGQIVFARHAGVTDATVEAQMSDLFAEVSAVPHVTRVVSPYSSAGSDQISKDRTVAYATIQFNEQEHDIPARSLNRIRGLVGHERGIDVQLGGGMFKADSSLGPAELIGIMAAVVILLVAFGSLIAMGLPILMALVGVAMGGALVGVLSHFVSTPDFATSLASMIGIGVGIDYALFIITRYRQALDDGMDLRPAVEHAIDSSGRAVLFAGCTVVISILGLFLMGVEALNGMAVGTAVTIVIVMVASVTLLPALLGFVGRNIERFSIGRRRGSTTGHREGVWFRWSRLVQRRPWPALVGALVLLVVLAMPLLSMRLAFSDAGANATSDTTRQAYDLVTRGFGPGYNGPLVLAAEFPRGSDTTSLDRLVESLRTTQDVAAVQGPTTNPRGDAAVIQVTPGSSPSSRATSDLVNHLRSDIIPQTLHGTDVTVHVGGLTASSTDVSDRLSARLPLFIGVVLLLSFLLLMAVFRSLLVPLKAVVMNLLSIGAAYGVVVAIFQWGWLADVFGVPKTGPIMPYFPMMMFAILFGLSMDYEVFMLSRIREEYDRTGDNALAVADGLASTARIITAAALIMVAVFSSFVLGDSATIKLFGIGLATAILIDATIVRMVLVPATMELLGDANWWLPRWLDRVLPRLHVEPPFDPEAERVGLDGEPLPPALVRESARPI